MQNNIFNYIWDLKTNISLTAGNQPIVMTITSTVKGEGKTIVASHLASAFAKSGQNVLLIDANLRRPGLSKLLNIAASEGIAEFLTGEKPLSGVMRATDDKRLSVIPCTAAMSNPLKTLNSSSTKIKELMDLAKPAHDIIIFDTCSVEDGSEPLLLSAVADKIIYVLASQCVSARRAENAISALRRSNPEKIGIVLNKVREINLY